MIMGFLGVQDFKVSKFLGLLGFSGSFRFGVLRSLGSEGVQALF